MAAEQPIAELTRRAFEHWNARDFEGLLELFHETAIWDMTPTGIPGMGEYRGHAAIRRWFGQWLEVFPDSDVSVTDVEVRGEWGLASVVQHVTGGSSGAPVPFRYYGIGHWHEGRLTFVENHIDETAGREAFRHYTEERRPELELEPA